MDVRTMIQKDLKRFSAFCDKNAAQLYTGGSIALFAISEVSTVYGTIKGTRKIDEIRANNNGEKNLKEEVKSVWKYGIIPVLSFAGGTYCAIKADRENKATILSLVAGGQAASSVIDLYKEKGQEIVGKSKADQIDEEVLKARVGDYTSYSGEWKDTGTGNLKVIDPWTGMHFLSSIPAIKAAINTVNFDMMNGGDSACVNDLYYELNLEPTLFGKANGWNIRRGLIELDDKHLSFEGGTDPIFIMGYNIAPRQDYEDL